MRPINGLFANYKNGNWDEGTLTSDDKVVISECAGVLQYAQTCFEGMKAYTTEDGHIVIFRPDLNACAYGGFLPPSGDARIPERAFC